MIPGASMRKTSAGRGIVHPRSFFRLRFGKEVPRTALCRMATMPCARMAFVDLAPPTARRSLARSGRRPLRSKGGVQLGLRTRQDYVAGRVC